MRETEVLVIGGGVVGCFIARELSRYKLDIILVEKRTDVCTGISKANTALVHAGFNADADKLKGRLNVRGNELYHRRVEHELDISLEWIGALVVAQNQEETETLERLYENGKKNGVKDLEILKGDQLFELEPNLNSESVAALYAPTAGIVNPFELTVALANNAVENDAEVLLEAEVLDIEDHGDYKIVDTAKGKIKAEVVINAAGVYADEIAKMVGIDKFEITPRRGEYYLYDKLLDMDVNHTIFQAPKKHTKGIVVTPTDEGNLLIGPNAEEIDDKRNKSTTREGLDEVFEGAKKTLPELSKRGVIKEFAGLRPAIKETEDFLIEASKKVAGFINAAGIQSPGLASAPAIAEMVVGIVKDETSLDLEEDLDFDPHYSPPFVKMRELDHEERAEYIAKNPDYGRIICRCETVSKAEIMAAIKEPVGAQTINAVKRRTRPGGGRCQGGFCQPWVLNMIAEELDIPKTEVKLEYEGSELLVDNIKDPLLKRGDSNE